MAWGAPSALPPTRARRAGGRLALVAQARAVGLDALVHLDIFPADLAPDRAPLGLRGLADVHRAGDVGFFRDHRLLAHGRDLDVPLLEGIGGHLCAAGRDPLDVHLLAAPLGPHRPPLGPPDVTRSWRPLSGIRSCSATTSFRITSWPLKNVPCHH